MQISGWLQCWWWWCVRLLDWLEPVIPPHQLCVCCAVVYRPGATTGYDIVAAQPSAQRQAANRASYTPYSPTATLSSSHYYYHILALPRHFFDLRMFLFPLSIFRFLFGRVAFVPVPDCTTGATIFLLSQLFC